MKNIFLKDSCQPITCVDDIEECTNKIMDYSQKIKDFKDNINNYIYIGSYFIPVIALTIVLIKQISFSNIIFSILLSCFFSMAFPVLLVGADAISENSSWRKKLNNKFFSLFKSFNHDQKLKSDYNEQLNQSLLDPNIERELILMLNNTLDLCKKADNEHSIENINSFRSQLIQYFATKNYKDLNIFITEHFDDWKHTQISMTEEIENNKVYNNYMEQVSKFTKTNKVTYLEEEVELELFNNKPQISF